MKTLLALLCAIVTEMAVVYVGFWLFMILPEIAWVQGAYASILGWSSCLAGLFIFDWVKR